MIHFHTGHIRYIRQLLQGLLLIGMVFLIFSMTFHVKQIQETSMVLEYISFVRGGTQRLVKLEIAGLKNTDLENSLDEIITSLQTGDGIHHLPALPDAGYSNSLTELTACWDDLKTELSLARTHPYEQTRLLEMSEEYFRLADDAVNAVETYSQTCIRRAGHIETWSILLTIAVMLLLLQQSLEALQLARFNRELRQKAYMDLHTGLPNKSRCEEFFSDHQPLSSPTCCIMFDLNNLKEVNDTLGHIAGDTMILNFAHILRTSIPEEHFVGRYGGDEFIAILRGTSAAQVHNILKGIQDAISLFNQYSGSIRLSYACGYAMSAACSDCCLTTLLERADHNMYTDKRKHKEKAPVP